MEEEVLKLIQNVPDAQEKIGEIFSDMVKEEYTEDIGEGVLQVIAECKTDEEFFLVNKMLMATCGYFFETLVEKIQERDDNSYDWNYSSI